MPIISKNVTSFRQLVCAI